MEGLEGLVLRKHAHFGVGEHDLLRYQVTRAALIKQGHLHAKGSRVPKRVCQYSKFRNLECRAAVPGNFSHLDRWDGVEHRLYICHSKMAQLGHEGSCRTLHKPHLFGFFMLSCGT